MKTERLVDGADNSDRAVVSNYHIKTLMLWTSELKPRSWWTQSLNVVRICVELLHSLSDACCPHYFVNNCNLVDSSQGVSVDSHLMSLDEEYLSTWFVNKYIAKCAQLCPDCVLQLFNDASTTTKLQNVVSAIVQFRINASTIDLCSAVNFAEMHILTVISHYGLTARSYVSWKNELRKCDVSLCLSEYFSAVALLHVAYKISKYGFDDNMMDILSTTLGQYNDTPRNPKQLCSIQFLSKAAKLMKVVANNLYNTTQLIEIELSKVYLHRAMRCKDSDSDSIYCLANVYLAVLYYTTGQYQTVVDHCTLVTRSQDDSQCSSRVIKGELLPKIDDKIDNILGLVVFYQYIISVALNQQQQRKYVGVFTAEMFAYYLHYRLLSVTQYRQDSKTPISDLSQRCIKCMSDMRQLLLGDVLILKSLSTPVLEKSGNDNSDWNIRGRSSISETELDRLALGLIELLQQSAVKHLTASRQLKAQDLSSVTTIVTTDFEALYTYKRGDYQRCLQLSTQNIRTLFHAVPIYIPLTFLEFTQLLDDDIVSLTALMLIVNRECKHDSENVCISQLTLLLYLMTQCHLKLRHSVTSLARTLDYVKLARRSQSVNRTLDLLTLKLAECKATMHVRRIMNESHKQIDNLAVQRLADLSLLRLPEYCEVLL